MATVIMNDVAVEAVFVADEDLHGQNVLLLIITSFLLRELLRYLRESYSECITTHS